MVSIHALGTCARARERGSASAVWTTLLLLLLGAFVLPSVAETASLEVFHTYDSESIKISAIGTSAPSPDSYFHPSEVTTKLDQHGTAMLLEEPDAVLIGVLQDARGGVHPFGVLSAPCSNDGLYCHRTNCSTPCMRKTQASRVEIEFRYPQVPPASVASFMRDITVSSWPKPPTQLSQTSNAALSCCRQLPRQGTSFVHGCQSFSRDRASSAGLIHGGSIEMEWDASGSGQYASNAAFRVGPLPPMQDGDCVVFEFDHYLLSKLGTESDNMPKYAGGMHTYILLTENPTTQATETIRLSRAVVGDRFKICAPRSAASCAARTTCTACQADAGCGWCASTNTCLAAGSPTSSGGTAAAPAACPSGWSYRNCGSCASACSALTTCSSCLSSTDGKTPLTTPGCAWCVDSNRCIPASDAGLGKVCSPNDAVDCRFKLLGRHDTLSNVSHSHVLSVCNAAGPTYLSSARANSMPMTAKPTTTATAETLNEQMTYYTSDHWDLDGYQVADEWTSGEDTDSTLPLQRLDTFWAVMSSMVQTTDKQSLSQAVVTQSQPIPESSANIYDVTTRGTWYLLTNSSRDSVNPLELDAEMFTDYSYSASVSVGAGIGGIVFRSSDKINHYILDFSPRNDIYCHRFSDGPDEMFKSRTLRLRHRSAGTWRLLYENKDFGLAPSVFHNLTVKVFDPVRLAPAGSVAALQEEDRTVIHVYVDGALIISYVDTHVDRPRYGTVGLITAADPNVGFKDIRFAPLVRDLPLGVTSPRFNTRHWSTFVTDALLSRTSPIKGALACSVTSLISTGDGTPGKYSSVEDINAVLMSLYPATSPSCDNAPSSDCTSAFAPPAAGSSTSPGGASILAPTPSLIRSLSIPDPAVGRRYYLSVLNSPARAVAAGPAGGLNVACGVQTVVTMDKFMTTYTLPVDAHGSVHAQFNVLTEFSFMYFELSHPQNLLATDGFFAKNFDVQLFIRRHTSINPFPASPSLYDNVCVNKTHAVEGPVDAPATCSDWIDLTKVEAQGTTELRRYIKSPSPGTIFYIAVYVTVKPDSELVANGASPQEALAQINTVLSPGPSSSPAGGFKLRAVPPQATITKTTLTGNQPRSYILIDGRDFAVWSPSTPDSLSVTVGGFNAPIHGGSSRNVIALVPEGGGKDLVVRVRSYNYPVLTTTASLTYAAPHVTSIFVNPPPPTSGTDASSLLFILGSNFGLATSTRTVTVGGSPCIVQPDACKQHNTCIKCIMPPGSGAYAPVNITVEGQSVLSTVGYAKPFVSSRTPAVVNVADTITINGANFGAMPMAPTVADVDLTACDAVANAGKVFVTVGGEFCAPIAVSGLPKSHTVITCVAPVGSGTSQPLVVCVDGQSTSTTISYAPPRLDRLELNHGPTHDASFKLIGYNFGKPATSLPCVETLDLPQQNPASTLSAQVLSNTEIEIRNVHAAVNTLPLRVTISGQHSNALLFQFDAPTVTAVTSTVTSFATALAFDGTTYQPSTILTVDGANFGCVCPGAVSSEPQLDARRAYCCNLGASALIVYFANDPSRECLNVRLITPTRLTCSVPEYQLQQGPSQALKVVVNRVGVLSTENHFISYAPPTVTSISPTSAAASTFVTITGSNFGLGGPVNGKVYFGAAKEYSCTDFARWTHDTIVCVVSAGQGINLPITVEVAGQLSAAGTATFSYAAPIILSVTPPSGPTAGSVPAAPISITVRGENFGLGGSLVVGTEPCTTALDWQTTSITCELPAGQGKSIDVVVTTGGQSSAASAATKFSYNAPVISNVSPRSSIATNGSGVVTVTGSNLGKTGAVIRAQPACFQVDVCNDCTPAASSAFMSFEGTVTRTYEIAGFVGGGYHLITDGAARLHPLIPHSGTYTILAQVMNPQAITVEAVTASTPINLSLDPLTDSAFSWRQIASAVSLDKNTFSIRFSVASGSFSLDAIRLCESGSVAMGSVTAQSHDSIVFETGARVGHGYLPIVDLGGWTTTAAIPFSFAPPTITGVIAGDAKCTSVAAISGGQIAQVKNCARVDGGTGGALITIQGSNFGTDVGDISVHAQSPASSGTGNSPSACTNVQRIDSSTITCTLPLLSRGGSRLPLVVSIGGLATQANVISYEGPVIVTGSLRFGGANLAECKSLTQGGPFKRQVNNIDDVLVCFQVSGGSADTEAVSNIVVTYGVPAPTPLDPLTATSYQIAQRSSLPATGYWFTCKNLEKDPGATAPLTWFACRMGQGVGENLQFKIQVGPLVSDLSDASVDSVSYAKPDIKPNTIRQQVNGARGAVVNSEATEGDWVVVDVEHLPFEKPLWPLLKVFTLDPVSTKYNPCGSLAVVQHGTIPTQSIVRCLTAPGRGDGHKVIVFALGVATQLSQDMFNYYSNAPSVTSVTSSACTASGNSVTQCSTAVALSLTINGNKFCDPADPDCIITIKVGSYDCNDIERRDSGGEGTTPTQLSCKVPSGTGRNHAVVVVVMKAWSDTSSSAPTVSYSDPVVSHIAPLNPTNPGSCVKVANNLGVIDCPIAGGAALGRIVITGQNFGTEGAIVLVGGRQCTDVVHGGTAAAPTLTCTLPAGRGENERVYVIAPLSNPGTNPLATVSYAKCPAGYYRSRSVTASSVCQECQPGTYNTSPGATSCVKCPGGMYQPLAGKDGCLSCGAGTYAPIPTEASAVGATACTACPLGTYGGTDTQLIACHACPAGRYFNGTANALPYISQCLACPSGRYTSLLGSTACFECKLGTYSNPQPGDYTVACEACPAGTFANGVGASTCTACAAGKYTAVSGMWECTDAKPGRFAYKLNDRYITSMPCDPGSYTKDPRASECTRCDQGSSTLVAGGLTPIALSAGQTVCSQCNAGTFQNDVGQSSCALCTPGLFSEALGSDVCEACPKGKFASTTQSPSCTLCPEGKFASGPASAECTLCPAGRFANATGFDVCAACPAGRMQPEAGKTVCQLCPKGTAQKEGAQTFCGVCEAGKFTNVTEQTTCQECPVGKVRPYSDRLELYECVSVPKGYIQPLPGQAEGVPCTAGSFVATEGAQSCEQCPKGTISAAAATTCVECQLGTFAAVEGSSSCSNCAAGTFANATRLSACYECEKGKYQDREQQDMCAACEVGRYSNVESKAVTCLPCRVGTFANDTGMTYCRECEAGKEQPVEASSYCNDCVAGTFSALPAQARCAPCPAGHFSETKAATECGICDIGRFAAQRASGRGASTCTDCRVGQFVASTGQAACQSCSVGSFGNETKLAACHECSPGRYAGLVGVIACASCTPGTYAPNAGMSVCLSCQLGYHQPNSSAIECVQCPAGRAQGAQGSEACNLCAAGTFSTSAGAETCTACAAGTYQKGMGMSVCEQCPVGKFSKDAGMSMCVDCEVGHAAPTPGAQICTACLPGKFADAPGSTTCRDCAAGLYQNSNKMSFCYACPPGTQSSSQSVECQDCNEGMVTPFFGSTTCYQCDATAVATNKRSCACSVGQYFPFSNTSANLSPDQFGSIKCRDCPEGGLCQSDGLTIETILAGVGWWRPDSSSTSFYRCINPIHCTATGCAQNRQGPICAICSPGSREIATGECVVCEDVYGLNIVQMVFIVLAIVVAMFLLCYLILYSDRNLVMVCKFADELAIQEHDDYQLLRQRLMRKMKELNVDYEEEEAADLVEEDAHLDKNLKARADRINKQTGEKEEGKDKDDAEADSKKKNNKDGDGEGDGDGNNDDDDEPLPTRVEYRAIGKPNLTYKIKILLGFFQISTNMTAQLSMPWPPTFMSFVNVFSVLNLDFVQWSNVNCVTSLNYFVKLVLICCIPILFIAAIFCIYYFPYYWRHRSGSASDVAARRRQLAKTSKLVLFSIFLVYPKVSSSLFNMYVCREIEGRAYLQSDFNIVCFEDEWNLYLPFNLVMILCYPIGIPVVMFTVLYRNRDRMLQPLTRLQYGFLYDGFARHAWWFELVDLSHKLFLTSVLAFFPSDMQIPVAMVVCIGYLIVILLSSPYFRKGDDRLHLFAQVEIFLIVLGCYVFYRGEKLDFKNDVIISTFLIFVILCFALLFISQVVNISRKLLSQRFACCRSAKERRDNEERAKREAEAEAQDRKRVLVMLERSAEFQGQTMDAAMASMILDRYKAMGQTAFLRDSTTIQGANGSDNPKTKLNELFYSGRSSMASIDDMGVSGSLPRSPTSASGLGGGGITSSPSNANGAGADEVGVEMVSLTSDPRSRFLSTSSSRSLVGLNARSPSNASQAAFSVSNTTSTSVRMANNKRVQIDGVDLRKLQVLQGMDTSDTLMKRNPLWALGAADAAAAAAAGGGEYDEDGEGSQTGDKLARSPSVASVASNGSMDDRTIRAKTQRDFIARIREEDDEDNDNDYDGATSPSSVKSTDKLSPGPSSSPPPPTLSSKFVPKPPTKTTVVDAAPKTAGIELQSIFVQPTAPTPVPAPAPPIAEKPLSLRDLVPKPAPAPALAPVPAPVPAPAPAPAPPVAEKPLSLRDLVPKPPPAPKLVPAPPTKPHAPSTPPAPPIAALVPAAPPAPAPAPAAPAPAPPMVAPASPAPVPPPLPPAPIAPAPPAAARSAGRRGMAFPVPPPPSAAPAPVAPAPPPVPTLPNDDDDDDDGEDLPAAPAPPPPPPPAFPQPLAPPAAPSAALAPVPPPVPPPVPDLPDDDDE